MKMGFFVILPFLIPVLAGCGFEKEDLEPISVFPGPGPAAALFQIANKRGYFEEQGLNATLLSYETGPQSILALYEGKLDVAHPADFAFVKQSFDDRRKNLRIIGSVIRWGGIEMVARKDRGIMEPSDLKGNNIALALDTQSELALADFLNLNGLSLDDVQLVNIESREKAVDVIEKGEVDAVVTVNQFVYEIQNLLDENAVTWPLQEGFPAFPLLVTTQEKIDMNPEIYERLLKAMAKAVDYANENPEEIKKTAKEVYGYDEKFLDFFWSRIRFEMSLPQELIIVMESEARWLVKNKLVNATEIPNYLDFIYFDAMDAARPKASTIIR